MQFRSITLLKPLWFRFSVFFFSFGYVSVFRLVSDLDRDVKPKFVKDFGYDFGYMYFSVSMCKNFVR